MMASRAAPAPAPLAGLAAGAGAYILWGLFPFYFKGVAEFPALEIVAWRVILSVVTLLPLLLLGNAAAEVRQALRERRTMLLLALAALLLAANWLVYVLAVIGGQVLDASLGYFMCPLVMVALGVTVLRERPSGLLLVAVGLAAVAVLVQIVGLGVVPRIALFLAVSFGLYGLLRKRIPVGAVAGLFLECLLVLPFAVLLLAWLAGRHGLAFPTGGTGTDLLLLAAGAVTVAPLLLFGLGARRLSLTTVGLLQYIAPSLIFLEGAFLFGEPLSAWRLTSFALIWAALALSTIDGLRRR
jgi:chloramphenicol-sensitive protein RarD